MGPRLRRWPRRRIHYRVFTCGGGGGGGGGVDRAPENWGAREKGSIDRTINQSL